LDIKRLKTSKEINILNDSTKLNLEYRRGSLKINSSTIGYNKEIFNILNKLKFIPFKDGNKLKYINGPQKSSPKIMSLARRIRNDFQTIFKNEESDLISNCFSRLGFLRNIIKSLKSIIFNLKID
jgi:hypothetical protein